MPDSHISPMPGRRLLLTALGRQRVGKTALLNATVQFLRAKGVPIEVWNADQQNRTHSLSTFFPDALVPPQGGLGDSKAWIEGMLVEQVRRGSHAVLDPGGGFTGFTSLVEELPVLNSLSLQGTDVVGLFCIGPEQADLDYLQAFAETGSFLPEKTVIVLNEGLVMSGRSARGAFATVVGSPVVRDAVSRGAEVIQFPALSCMAAVTDRGISFADGAANRVRPGQEPLSLFDPVRVNEWWTKKIPGFFAEFPHGWLPVTVPAAAERSEGGRDEAGQ